MRGRTGLLNVLFLFFAMGLACSSILCARSDEEVEEIIRNSPWAADYPQAGAVYLLDEIRISMDEDGLVTKECHRLIKIFQDRARDTLSDQKIRFHGEKQSVELIRARTIRADGSAVEPEQDGIMEVSDMEASDAPFYSNARIKVVSFPAVEPGAILDLKYKISPTKGKGGKGEDYLQGEEYFQYEEPIREKVLEIRLPKSRSLFYELANSRKEPETVNEDDFKVYRWTFKDIPQIIEEPDMVPKSHVSPRLFYSTLKTWNAVGAWLGEKFEDKIKLNGKLKKKVNEIVQDKESLEDKIKALVLFCATEVRNVSLPLGRVSFEPTEAPRILDNMYADAKDKAVLLAAMLRHLKVEAHPAFVNGTYDKFVDLPALAQFNSVVVKIVAGPKKSLWVDPSSDDTEYGFLPAGESGRSALVIGEAVGIETTPVADETVNFCKIRARLELGKGGELDSTFEIDLSGSVDSLFRSTVKDKTDKEIKMFFQEFANRFKAGTTLTSFTIADPKRLDIGGRIELSMKTPRYAAIQDSMMLFDIPDIAGPLGLTGFAPSLPDAKYPVLVEDTALREFKMILQFPENARVFYAPEDLEIENEWMVYSMKKGVAEKELTLSESTTWFRGEIERRSYPRARIDYTETGLPKRKLILFELNSP
jgi:hypothetical protein